ncbi:MAG TPA: alpha-1,4-glucan--maltose-1-phosphate maltosyltransferase [Pirellulales bacterium]|jgi:starch synthase (maltosyl-transferring)|nr:alpha-1,4-glucan--maltose-1-phosphate maltosyltransferase [Pirellulales bacterium]
MKQHEADFYRVAIEGIRPNVDGGFAVKRTIGDELSVEADVFADGHEEVVAVLQYRHESSHSKQEDSWLERPLTPLGNDRWRVSIPLESLGQYVYRILGWVDRFHTWRHDLKKRNEAGQNLLVDLLIGAELITAAALRAKGTDGSKLTAFADQISASTKYASLDQAARYVAAMDEHLLSLMDQYADRSPATISTEFEVVVDAPRATFSAWYELFPRSCSPVAGKHGTFLDVIAHLPYVAEMGFDVLYLPPIHPIGKAFRKGKNNQEQCEAGDVGSPWAIGAAEGGHKSVHPELGNLEDFRKLVATAQKYNIEIALDIAFQCSPDHPYVKEHPQWFRSRPDGTIQYAENPPKKYQDIYPFDFECNDWRALWEELKSVFMFWLQQGVHIFRVDNPHTKPFDFWEWCIAEVKRARPDAIFLAEAFTRPKIMYRLAKLGFTQSYTYFTWRNTKQELTEYFTELSQPALADIFRPNLWTNTPDILHDYLQRGGQQAFAVRAVLAATLSSNWGVYGPAYELLERTPRDPGSEEYLHSEKYELKHWDVNQLDSLRHLLSRLNRIRRQQPALQRNENLTFHAIDSDQLLAYSKRTSDASNLVLAIVNLDPRHAHSGWLELPLDLFRLSGGSYEVVDLLSDRTFLWQGARAYVELDPSRSVAHVLQMRREISG